MGLSMARKRRKRRHWSDEEKLEIVAQTRVPGVSVSRVARRYDVNANLVFKWLRDPRFCPTDDLANDQAFLPVEMVAEPEPAIVDRHEPATAMMERSEQSPSQIEIVLSNGHRVRLSGRFDTDAVARLLRGLVS